MTVPLEHSSSLKPRLQRITLGNPGKWTALSRVVSTLRTSSLVRGGGRSHQVVAEKGYLMSRGDKKVTPVF